jgi:hypothetical protein
LQVLLVVMGKSIAEVPPAARESSRKVIL